MASLNLSPQEHFYLQTTFQSVIEYSLQRSSLGAPENTPYIHKYQAIDKLKGILSDNLQSQQKKPKHPFDFILYIILGQVYSDVEQTSDSVRSYEAALISYQHFIETYASQQEDLIRRVINLYSYSHYLLVIYNMLGLSYINRDQDDQGLGCFGKARNLYSSLIEFRSENPEHFINCYHNRSDEANNRQFRCYYMGGVNFEEVQSSYTLTLFYLAQSYTKLGLKQKAAETCGKTLQRQYETDKYELKEFCANLIGLAEYYQGNGFFAQCQYTLMLAMQILPQGKKKKSRAKLQIALGDLYGGMLQFCANKIKGKSPINMQDNENTNKCFLLFDNFKQEFPKVTLATDLEQSKSLFRKANTQYKKALEVFVLDGYVTQHIDILFALSKLYHNLCKIDLSRQRVCGMLDKRRELLEPLLKEINPKAYPATWQKILVETSEIYSDLFQLKTIIVIDVKDKNAINQQKLRATVKLGEQLNKYYVQIIDVLQNDKDAEKNEQYYRSIINSKFNISKMNSKMYSKDPKIRVEFLKKAWLSYKQVADYINKTAKPFKSFQKQLQLTNEMISMLPTKIDRINYGQVSPFE